MKARHQKCGNDSVDLSDPKGCSSSSQSVIFTPLSRWKQLLRRENQSHTFTYHTISSSKKTKPTCSLPILGLLTLLTKWPRKRGKTLFYLHSDTLHCYIVSGVKKSSWHKGWHVSPAHGCCSCFHSTLVTGVSHTFPEFCTPVGTWRWARTT